MRLSISIAGLDGLARGLREAPGYTDQVLQAAMYEATLLAKREWQENMPRGVTGLTAGSIHSDVSSTPAGVLGVVGSSQPSAVWVLTFAGHQSDARLQVFISVGQANNVFDRTCTKLDAKEPQQLLTGGV